MIISLGKYIPLEKETENLKFLVFVRKKDSFDRKKKSNRFSVISPNLNIPLDMRTESLRKRGITR